MNKLFGMCVAAVTPISAMAADLGTSPARAPIYTKAPMMAPAFTWTGFYIGGNAGYHFGDQNVELTAASGATLFLGNPALATSIAVQRGGFIGGGQVGYNYQLSPMFVVGLEADFQWADVSGSSTFDIAAPGGGFFPSRTQVQDGLRDLGTVRGRLGFAVDRFMIYGTGGFAYGEVTNSTTVSFFPSGVVGVGTPNVLGLSVRDLQTGYAVGG